MSPHPDNDRLEDWAAETHESITARLEGAKAAQAQTRLTLGAMAVISVMMLIATYNAYLSYDYEWIVKAKCGEAAATHVPDILRDQAYRDWASSRTVLISLLGIRVSVDDAAILGTAVLLFLSLWLLLVARRENHTIGFLLRDTDTPRPAGPQTPPATEGRPKVSSNGERWLIYHTIISNSLFVIFDRLPQVPSLAGPNSLEAAARRGRDGRWDGVGLRLLRSFFFWFPVVTSMAVFIFDWRSYFRADPFDPLCNPEGFSPFFWRSRAVFFACWLPLAACCLKSDRYSRATERVLCKYGRKLFVNLKRRK